MNCIIVEDEQNAAEHLEYLLAQSGHDVNIEARLDSVESAVLWLKSNQTELIFLDVQLADGNSFSIFENVQVNTPVIFTTSYDEYAIKAFKLNSIAYLLKPVDKDELEMALSKYRQLYSEESLSRLGQLSGKFQKRFMIQKGNAIHMIRYDEIAYFNVEHRNVFITTLSGERYLFESTLESLEQRLSPEFFFRVNRQYILSINSIGKMFNETRGRVRIETNPAAREEIVVSIDRASEFKRWLKK